MSEISYFPSYNKPENQVTNYTQLVLRYFYQESPQKLEKILSLLLKDVLSSLSEGGIVIGPYFKQQIKLKGSIPDALISQKPLNIYFEVKSSEGKLNTDQIERHINFIKSNEDGVSKVLFSLTPDKIPDETAEGLWELAEKEEVTFAAITFTDIFEALKENCAPHETKLQDILNDYEQFLRSKKLITGESMIVMPVRYSMEDNKKFHMCFEKVKHHKAKISSKFIGLYASKCISYIGGCIATIVRGKFEGDEFNVEAIEFSRTNKKELTPDEYQRIIDLSFNISQSNGQGKDHPIKTKPHRFYLFDELKETNFIKETKYGVRQPSTVYLSQWLNDENKKEYDTAEVADILRNKTW